MGWEDIFQFGLRVLAHAAVQKSDSRSSITQPSTATLPDWSVGDIVAGAVEFVRADFAKIDVSGTKVCIFKSHAACRRVDDMGEILQIGQKVEAVLLNPSDRKPGEWVASLAAVDEARRRLAIGRLIQGCIFKGAVNEITERAITLMVDGVEVYVPRDELSWEWIDHPGEKFKFGQNLDVRIEEITTPENWWTNPRKLRSRVRGSVKACQPKPASPVLRMPFRAVPFTLKASVNKPRSCDEVVVHVLECLAAGLDRVNIAALTGLPDSAFFAISSLLVEEKLLDPEGLTHKGERLVRSVVQARALKARGIGGFFLSAAHPQSCVVMSGSPVDPSRDLVDIPCPPFVKKKEDELSRQPQLVKLAIASAGADANVMALRRAVVEGDLHLYLQRDPGRWRTVWLDTPLNWILASLWRSFDPVGSRPYRPASVDGPPCKQILMVRSTRLFDDASGQPSDDCAPLFTEPFSQTIWRIRDCSSVTYTDRKSAPPEKRFLEFPTAASAFGEFGATWRHQWCLVRFP